MSKKLHIKPRKPLAAGEKWNSETGCLTLAKAGLFTVEIVQTDALHEGAPKKLPPFDRVTQDEIWKIKDYDTRYWLVQADKKRDEDEAKYKIEKEAFNKKLQNELNSISWCWEAVGKGMSGRTMTHNASFGHGLPLDLLRQVRFPKLLEGGGPAWLEVFTENDPATGKRPHGIFVNATGTPKIIAAEWRDFTGRLITEEIAFGSTVYLHIYTEALYGEDIKIQLVDNSLYKTTNLTPTPSDENGDPVQKLDPKALTQFTRPVKAHQYNATTKPPAGTITDAMIFDKGKDQVSGGNVQKCVFPVFIEHGWQFQVEGEFNNGTSLSIKPIVHHSKIENQEKRVTDCVLKIAQKGILKKGELSGNNPLLLDEPEKGVAPEDKKKIDFTFGIFIDGTLNNSYNTIARQKFEERTGKKAASQEIVKKKGEKKYRYTEESSYENDLSNPAILYQNYVENLEKNIFKIYTEGIGTLTTPKEGEVVEKAELDVEDYKDDDTVGYALGTTGILQNTGIKAKVRKAITAMADKIKEVMKKNTKYTVGTITVDVFGFSRGAAAARHFVHEITRPAYNVVVASNTGRIQFLDIHRYEVDEKYKDKQLPSHGHLGYLLTEANKTFDKLVIRFAGLYDTVPHHGIVQDNDIKDLGLNSINKANYVVHLVAADEHRANFDLAAISSVTKTDPYSGQKGGIELYLPGVHCDVGGSYVEGMPEYNARLEAFFDYKELNKLKKELVHQGWFKEEELIIRDNVKIITEKNAQVADSKLRMESYREYLSNQYSYIPLHMMVKFCKLKEVPINIEDIKKGFDFKENNIEENIKFLKRIKKRLYEYAFEFGKPYDFEEAQQFKQPDIMYSPEQSHQALQEYHERQLAGQEILDKANAEKNADIKLLRNLYLHWNSVYGQEGTDIALQAHMPNKENGQRKRTIK